MCAEQAGSGEEAAGAHDLVDFADGEGEGGAARGHAEAVGFGHHAGEGFAEDAGEAGMHRQTTHLTPAGRQLLMAVHGAKPAKEQQGGLERPGRRSFEPVERAWIAAPREDVEDRPGQIDPGDIGSETLAVSLEN